MNSGASNNSQMSIMTNVTIGFRNAKTNVTKRRLHFSNKITRIALMAMANLLYGNTEGLKNYVPMYFALGSSSSNVTVNDSSLGDEITTTVNGSQELHRIGIAQRSITTDLTNSQVRVIYQGYIQSNVFNDVTIREAGLFASTSGNNCLARFVIDEDIVKSEEEVIDIKWTITIKSDTNT